MVRPRGTQQVGCGCPCCLVWCIAAVFAMASLFAFYDTVTVAVDEASLFAFYDTVTLAAPGNGTAFLAYNISLAVAVHNPNLALRAWRTAPLDAELRFRGRPFATVRLGTAGAGWSRIRARRTEVHRVVSAAERAPVELGSDRVAEFARERAAGEFELGLIVAGGKFKYQAHGGRHSIRVSCPLKVSLPTSTAAAAAFARVKYVHGCLRGRQLNP